MATRSGTVDPGLAALAAAPRRLDADALEQALERQAGLLGLAGTADMREVLAARRRRRRAGSRSTSTSTACARAIAAMAAALGGLDALVFTGGVGEHAAAVRAGRPAGLGFLGVALDAERNARAAADAEIGAPGAAVRALVVTAREDLEIARGVRSLSSDRRSRRKRVDHAPSSGAPLRSRCAARRSRGHGARPERFDEVLTSDALAMFQRTIARGHELLGATHIWNVNSTARGGGVAEMLRSLIGYVARGGDRRPLGGHRAATPEFFAHHQAPPQPAARRAGRRRPAGRRGARALRARCAANAAAARGAAAARRRGDPPRPADRRDAPAARGAAGVAGDLARAHRPRPAQRPRARGVGLPHALRRARPTRTCSRAQAFAWEGLDRGRVSVIPPSIDAFSPEEPRDGVHQHRRGAARRGPGRRPTTMPRGRSSSASTAASAASSAARRCSRRTSCASTVRCSCRSRAGTR